ncbi:hypothetical protein GQ44DRAFT_816589 [Phaeosphaeriaceae sp. PMI808]|nr:hypothetical protein GQ44DRAFT_816589 [Phaeosphaeriaceae sp. PMI808]
MFCWYQQAERCYVYLSDVSDSTTPRRRRGKIDVYASSNTSYVSLHFPPEVARRSTFDDDGNSSRRWKPAFKKSKWFTRGWTLQELIAPPSVEFFSKERICLGNKQSLEQTLHNVTGIAVEAFKGRPLSEFGVDERFLWAKERRTTCEEDAAYCLLGIFDIQIPLLYAEGYEKALGRLKKEIREHASDRSLSLDDEQKRMLLVSLQFDQIDARQMTIKDAHAITCKWFLKKPEYLDWFDRDKIRDHFDFLWIKGKPGTRKSTLMKFALTHTRRTMKDKHVIAFFFNARGESIEKSTTGTYRSLLLQLHERLPALQRVFDSLGALGSGGIDINYQWSVEQLKALLEQAIELLGESSVVCFIDKCDEQQIREMIQFFKHISEVAVSKGANFRICLSSRHYPHITIQKRLGLVLEGHNQDITN